MIEGKKSLSPHPPSQVMWKGAVCCSTHFYLCILYTKLSLTHLKHIIQFRDDYKRLFKERKRKERKKILWHCLLEGTVSRDFHPLFFLLTGCVRNHIWMSLYLATGWKNCFTYLSKIVPKCLGKGSYFIMFSCKIGCFVTSAAWILALKASQKSRF